MTPLDEDEPDGATPITPEEREGLKLTWITTRGDLNEAELAAISGADAWAIRRRPPAALLVAETFLLKMHQRMLGAVWRWAGKLRTSERNLGVAHWQIRIALRDLLQDVQAMVLAEYGLPPDEIAVRFHHRLVAIHPFVNGNGRHARLTADLLVIALGHPRFTWGSGQLGSPSETRRAYVGALRAADAGDMGPLLVFARS